QADQFLAELAQDPQREVMRRVHPEPAPQAGWELVVEVDQLPQCILAFRFEQVAVAPRAPRVEGPFAKFQAKPALPVEEQVEALIVMLHPVGPVNAGWLPAHAPRWLFLVGHEAHQFTQLEVFSLTNAGDPG